jgi:hypothetical protein
MNMEKREGFLGTYFSKSTVLRLASIAKVFSWIILGFYALHWLVQVGVFVLQYLRGFMQGMGFTDYLQSLLILFEQPLRALVYFIVLQGVAQAMLMFMDMEDNTRKTARATRGR